LPFQVSNSGAYQGCAVAGIAGQGRPVAATGGGGVGVVGADGAASGAGDGAGAGAGGAGGATATSSSTTAAFCGTTKAMAAPIATAMAPSRRTESVGEAAVDVRSAGGRKRSPARSAPSIAIITVGDGPLAPKQPHWAAPDAIRMPRIRQKSASTDAPSHRATRTGPSIMTRAIANSVATIARIAGSR
jgi:hypothetical protein